MKKQTITAQYVQKLVLIILTVLSVVAAVTKIFTGFDIDEAYALAIPYRIIQGDRLFADMWEVHQTSFLVPYLFMELFYKLTGSMTGVVLYTRAVATVLHLLVSVLIYRFFDRQLSMEKKAAFLLALGYYNFLPKWMINLDFSMQQLWFFTLFLICLYTAAAAKRKQWMYYFTAGLLLALEVLAYPGMLVLYPAAVLFLFCQKDGSIKKRWQAVLVLTSACAAAAAVFFAMVFSYMTPQEFFEAVPHVFMDGSHQYDLSTKLGIYASQWKEALLQTVILLLPAAAAAGLFRFAYRHMGFERRGGLLPTGLLICAVFQIMVSGIITFAGMVVTWGPFRLQVRYIIQFAMAFYLFYCLYGTGGEKTEREKRAVGWLLWFSLASFVGILLASNVGPVSSSSYLVLGNLIFTAFLLKVSDNCGGMMKALAYAGAVLFLSSLIMCKGFYMRNTEYVPGDISQPLACVQEGPLAGVSVPVKDQVRYTRDYETIQQNTTDGDRVLFMGTEGLCNLYANGKIVIPTTISTPAFNEQWVEYFTLYPQKQPTVIFLAKNTVDDRSKFFVKNEFGIWIAERYNVECMEETDSLCILRPRK